MIVKRAKAIILSADFLLAIIVAIIIYFLLPAKLNAIFVRDIYSVGLSILAIIFSVFFAALAIIISSSDDEFVRFLEEDNIFTDIVSLYKFVLSELLVGLIYTFAIFCYTANQIANKAETQSKFLFLIFIFLFIYGILAVFSASLNSIKYAKKRSEFLTYVNSDKGKKD